MFIIQQDSAARLSKVDLNRALIERLLVHWERSMAAIRLHVLQFGNSDRR